MTFFEIITGMAFAAFADAPVDVAVIEVGLGGTWDATNVADADVAVVTPIDYDHTHLLGNTLAEIAAEKAGIIKPGAHAVLAGQPVEAAQVLLERCTEVGALVHLEGVDFGLIDRQLAVGGQLLRLNGAEGPVDDVFLPLHGAHQAANAAVALAAVETFLGMKALGADTVRDGFAQVQFPGRLELVRRSPSVILDAAHNPHGARATAQAVEEAFSFNPLIGVIAVMADKDAEGLLRTYEPIMDRVVVTQVASTSRGMPAEDLGALASDVFRPERVTVVPRLDDAIETAVALADAESAGLAGVLVTGSVVLVGEARNLLVRDTATDADGGTGPGRRHDSMAIRTPTATGSHLTSRTPVPRGPSTSTAGCDGPMLSAKNPMRRVLVGHVVLRGDRVRARRAGDVLRVVRSRWTGPRCSVAPRPCSPWSARRCCAHPSGTSSAGSPRCWASRSASPPRRCSPSAACSPPSGC